MLAALYFSLLREVTRNVLGCTDAFLPTAVGGVGVHGGCGCRHWLVRRWSLQFAQRLVFIVCTLDLQA